MEQKDFIKDCNGVIEIMENAKGQSMAITQRLIDTYKVTLEDLQKSMDKFSKIMAKKVKNEEIKRRPLSVTFYHTLFSLGFGTIFGALAGIGTSVLLGGANPALWSPALAGIGAAFGAVTFTPPFILKNIKLTKDYRNGKFDNKKRSLTNYLNKRSLKKNKLSTLATANEYSRISEEQINQYLSKVLSTNGLSKNNLDFLSKSKRKKIDKLLDQINDCKNSLNQTHSLLAKEKIIDKNLKLYSAKVETDELAVSTKLDSKPKVIAQRKTTIKKVPSSAHTNKSQEENKPTTSNIKTENNNTPKTHRQHKTTRH